jgi:hypothetical protein
VLHRSLMVRESDIQREGNGGSDARIAWQQMEGGGGGGSDRRDTLMSGGPGR